MNQSLSPSLTGMMVVNVKRAAIACDDDGPDTGGNVTSLPDVPADSTQVTLTDAERRYVLSVLAEIKRRGYDDPQAASLIRKLSAASLTDTSAQDEVSDVSRP